MSTTYSEAATPVPATSVPPQVQRCGGTTCPPGTCDHDDEVARLADGPGPTAVPQTVLGVLGTPGIPLDAEIRTSMAGRFGHDFGRVRIHNGADAARSAADIHALAYTYGSHVVMGAGRYQPHTSAGQRLLAHELTHVIQQGSPAGTPTSISDPHDRAEQAAERTAGLPVGPAATKGSGADTGVILRQATTASGGSGPDPCLTLLAEIIELLNEVAQRINEALLDEHDLFRRYRRIDGAHPDHGSWEGHERYFKGKRSELRLKLAEWDSKDDCRGRVLALQEQEDLDEAREFAEKEFPARPQARRETQEPEADPAYRERLTRALVEVGVPVAVVGALVGVIIYALLTPEPFSKIGSLIGVAAAIAFFVLIGRGDEVPGAATGASADSGPADTGGDDPVRIG